MNKKYCIVRRGNFWTGTGWTIVFQFCKRFDFLPAVTLIDKRFHRMTPLPKIEKCSKYESHKKKDEKKFLKKESKNV